MLRLIAALLACAVVHGQEKGQEIRAVAGESVSANLPLVSIVSATTEPPLRFPIDLRAEPGGIRLITPPATPPGTYRIRLTGRDRNGRTMAASLVVTVNAVTVPKSSSGKTPVILLNGFQFSCNGNISSTLLDSQSTFGQLATLLQADGVPVLVFNNCAYGTDSAIEQLAQELANYISSLTYTDGTPIAQVDLIAHSMGGLIARTYLAGLESNGAVSPPLNPKVRKLIQLATPNFGSFQAALLGGTQTTEMTLGSAFLWNLATWNQRQDDLRGVDALAVIGNAATNAQSDGIVSLTSGSLGFARPVERTRIVPYCHVTTSSFIAQYLNCAGQGIADIDGPSHLSAQIVRSFLADSADWMSVGKTASQDPYLSQFGGIYFTHQNAAAQWIADLTQVSFGSLPLNNGGAAGTVFYSEFAQGTGTFTEASSSLHSLNCGPFTLPPGYYTALRCKILPAIFSVTPFATGTVAKVVPAGAPITITGFGFGQKCANCTVLLNPGGVSLQVSSWTDQTIAAFLPAYNGIAQLVVNAAAGSDSINIMTTPPAGTVLVTAVVNAASRAGGAIAPGEVVTITGSGLGPSTAASFPVNPATGMVGTTLAGTRVFFGGYAAPILYTSATQVNAIVPYEVSGLAQLTIQASYQGNLSAGSTLQVASAAPGVFTTGSTGSGQAVAANQNGSPNGPSNPAAKGSYVTIYFTGGGQTNPPGATGSVTGLVLKWLTQNIGVTVGGQTATVTFDGAAPALVDGISQLNIRLGDNTPAGPAQPLVISVGGMSSPSTATIAVE